MNLEHANVTVSDPRTSAERLARIFDWHIRWEGESQLGGRTVHVGTDTTYLALWTPPGDPDPAPSGAPLGGLQHLGILVDDLETAVGRVEAEGLEPFNFMDYEPGRRFYFLDPDGIEFEVASYADSRS
jgi:glyoxylase I family protein